MSADRSIVIENAGPVGTFVVPVQPGGTILTGYCGVGKSITLEAIALGLGARERGRVSPRNGTKRGSIDCLGVVLNVSAGRITRSGESEVASIEDFDLGALIDPPVKDADARNRYGIKSLLRMTRAEADPSLFYHLAGGKEPFEAIIDPDAVKSDDLVEMAGKIKRAFESEKRKIEGQAEREEAAAAADRNAVDGLDLSSQTDTAVIQAAYGDAVARQSRLQQRYDAAQDADEAADQARQKLAEVGQASTQSKQDALQALESAKENRDVAVTAARDAKAEVARIEAELKAAKASHGSALVSQQAADDAVAAAEKSVKAVDDNAKLYTGWQAAIDAAANLECPKAEEILAATRVVTEARKAIETAAVVRAAKERLAKAEKHQKEAAKLRKRAFELQQAARDTDSVLSAAVGSERYTVDNGILMGKLPEGTVKPYYDLSDGERTLIATAEKIDQVRMIEKDDTKLAIIDLPQRTFQDIPGSVREMLFQRAAERNTCIVSGQVTDDKELRAVVWTPGMFLNGHENRLAGVA